mmetsp:Transcript_37096/g.90938  ORF Transcript_37096/g.90938 Transcript_37096/m.90938 type:complete len:104 (+) Transcript_37096:532-843(+)
MRVLAICATTGARGLAWLRWGVKVPGESSRGSRHNGNRGSERRVRVVPIPTCSRRIPTGRRPPVAIIVAVVHNDHQATTNDSKASSPNGREMHSRPEEERKML